MCHKIARDIERPEILSHERAKSLPVGHGLILPAIGKHTNTHGCKTAFSDLWTFSHILNNLLQQFHT